MLAFVSTPQERNYPSADAAPSNSADPDLNLRSRHLKNIVTQDLGWVGAFRETSLLKVRHEAPSLSVRVADPSVGYRSHGTAIPTQNDSYSLDRLFERWHAVPNL
ncbi:hypothetical protein [Oxynema aestuarii]|uniref:Uncharacterized protein n=1 Tax=Oxynema aestuarii AP17 TaxID=2064643 RepID=A0A6H1TT09_9CYAN|nr:hypothetical protein [Oxynema aestuarii]QIZ69734.1 hypothetical protein HCG48_03355 [Oxynema aestuarii AP17]